METGRRGGRVGMQARDRARSGACATGTIRRRSALAGLTVATALTACGGGGDTPAPADGGGALPLELVSATIASPALEGTPVRVRSRGADGAAGLELAITSGTRIILIAASAASDASAVGAGETAFELDATAVDALGTGRHDASVRLVARDGRESETLPLAFELVAELPVALADAPGGDVHRNDRAVLRGAGFVAPSEGTVLARLEGEFLADDAGARPVGLTAEVPVLPAQRDARDRGLLRLGTALGGLRPGRFTGSVSLEQTLRSGARSTSQARDLDVRFLEPELFALDPTRLSLGRIAIVRGAGFVGEADEPGAATVVRLSGAVTAEGSTRDKPLDDAELVLDVLSGTDARTTVEAVVRGDVLVSSVLGITRGRFRGTATPLTILGPAQVAGPPTPVELVLEAPKQVVWVRFLPGFYDSLPGFGLASAAGLVEERVAERMRGIYAGFGMDIRLEAPTDYAVSGFATLEIGGPDPNGKGLLGHDSTPGKDVGNLRLFDQIGGANAETQADGAPGYGGVFVDGFLYWSEAPGLPGPRPAGAPEPAPMFDVVFGPVRAEPARLDELRGVGSPQRVAAAQAALAAFAAMTGETASHEVGHSLGLAQPNGERDAFHRATDDPGCLMDRGGQRAFDERAALEGAAPTRFCDDEIDYLLETIGPGP